MEVVWRGVELGSNNSSVIMVLELGKKCVWGVDIEKLM